MLLAADLTPDDRVDSDDDDSDDDGGNDKDQQQASDAVKSGDEQEQEDLEEQVLQVPNRKVRLVSKSFRLRGRAAGRQSVHLLDFLESMRMAK